MVQPPPTPASKTRPHLKRLLLVTGLFAALALWQAISFSVPAALLYLPVVMAAAFSGVPGAAAGGALACGIVLAPALLRQTAPPLAVWLDIPLYFVFGLVVALLSRQASMLDRLAYCDPLTGLPDGARLRERLSEEIARTLREPVALALVLFDIDGLGAINERFDRSHGNRALCETAAAIRDSIRAFDIPGRLKDDEFALLLPDTPRDGAARVADRVRRAVEGRAAQSGLAFTVSAGIVEIGPAANSAAAVHNTDEYIGQAEAALFEARRTGRNRVVFYDPEMYGNAP